MERGLQPLTALHYGLRGVPRIRGIVDLLLNRDDIDMTASTPEHVTVRDLAFVMCHDRIVHKRDATGRRVSLCSSKGHQPSNFDHQQADRCLIWAIPESRCLR
jgi:hypothetical protein